MEKTKYQSLRQQSNTLLEKHLSENKQKLVDNTRSVEEEIGYFDNKLKESRELYNSEKELFAKELQRIDTERKSFIDSSKYMKEEIDSLEKRKRKLSSEVELLENDSHNHNKRQMELSNEISDLEQKKAALISEVGVLEDRRLDISRQIEQSEAQHTALLADNQRSLDVLDAKKNEVAQSIIDKQKADTEMMSDLAAKKKAIDLRDQNVRIREAKVSAAESNVIRNSNLMNL